MDGTVCLRARIPSCDDLHQEVLAAQAERRRIKLDLRAWPPLSALLPRSADACERSLAILSA